jgi:hypothetical protein
VKLFFIFTIWKDMLCFSRYLIIWKSRNDRICNNKLDSVDQEVEKAKVLAWCWYLGRLAQAPYLFHKWTREPWNYMVRWPVQGWLWSLRNMVNHFMAVLWSCLDGLRLWFWWAVGLEGELWICQFHWCGFSSVSAATKVYHFEYLGTDVFIWFSL